MRNIKSNNRKPSAGFTLVEVVLAIGILSVAVLALLAMFTPTMNNVRNVINSDFAVSSTGAINAHLQKLAADDFDNIEELVSRASQSKPSHIFLYVYIKNYNGTEEIFVTEDKEDVHEDLMDGNLLSAVLRVEIYRMITADNYDYNNIRKEAYIPMMLKIFSTETNNPEIHGNQLIAYPLIITR